MAVAYDADGGNTTSESVVVTVAINRPPTVALTSPANGATYTAPANVALTASASDPENRLSRVDFFAGSTKILSASASPYGGTWSSVPAGTYTLTAIAYDADGGQTTSSGITITVSAPPPPPSSWTVVFTASADHDTNVTSYRLDVFASGADPTTAQPISSMSLGKPTPDANQEIAVSEASFFTPLSPGDYLATVTAIGPDGEARSAPCGFSR
jgi:hypothetical protein